MPSTSKPRDLQTIAYEIMRKWANPHYAAIPYINAMTYLTDMDSAYGYESAHDIVLRFLTNAGTWRGEDAKRIKSELRSMLPKR